MRDLSLNEEMANVSTLTGESEDILRVGDAVKIPNFEGIVVNSRYRKGITNFTAFENAWKLRGIPVSFKHYFGWKLGDILNGKSTSNFEYGCTDNPRINVSFSTGLVEKGNVVISGLLNGVKYAEYIPLVETDYNENGFSQRRAKSKWCKDTTWATEPTSVAWNLLNAVHVEDTLGNIMYDLGSESVIVYDYLTTIATLTGTNCIFAKVKDSRAVNGILYDTDLNYSVDIDSYFLNTGHFQASGSNALEVLKSICSTPVSIGPELVPFNASFKIENNTLKIKGSTHKLDETLREGQEILSYRYSSNMEHITNKIGYTTNDNVYCKKDQESIDKYGLYETCKNISLDDIDAAAQVQNMLDHFRKPEETLVVEIYNKDISVGDKVHVKIPSLNIDEYKTIQKIVTKIGTEKVIQTVTLSEYTPFSIWLASIREGKKKQRLYDIFLRGVKRIKSYNFSDYFHKIVFSKSDNPGVIIASSRNHDYLETTPGGTDGHVHRVSLNLDSDIQLP